jgi:hypothetical protein
MIVTLNETSISCNVEQFKVLKGIMKHNQLHVCSSQFVKPVKDILTVKEMTLEALSVVFLMQL